MAALERARILPETDLPAGAALVAAGRDLARTSSAGTCPFLVEMGVRSESEHKRREMAAGRLMFHAQIGYRDLDVTAAAATDIYRRLAAAGRRVDRYGICLDWSMGYPAGRRDGMPRGTGLILHGPADFAALAAAAPVAPHFGDFVIGTPAAVENTVAALAAGCTSVGNLGQYFTFRMPRWPDDVGTTAETVKAIALCAAQPVEVLIHSNLDDGFAALFTDLACGIGAALIERYIVGELLGGRVAHCYGHTFSEPVARLGFLRAMALLDLAPGTMVYGNTTSYTDGGDENYAVLAGYLWADILGQRTWPTGHALNPVPVSEAVRIPSVDEIVEAHLFAHRLAERAAGYGELFDLAPVERTAARLVEGGLRFRDAVLAGLAEAGIDVRDPFELLLALRRVGARRLEALFGPGEAGEGPGHGRRPVLRATTIAALEAQADALVQALSGDDRAAVRGAGFTACVAATDVHEYGKLLVEATLRQLGVRIVDGGAGDDPGDVARRALDASVDFIAVSSYSGIALRWLGGLRDELREAGVAPPVFAGGKLNEIPEGEGGLPVDVTAQLRRLGVLPCRRVDDMLSALAAWARSGRQP